MAIAKGKDRVIVRAVVTALDSLLSTIYHVACTHAHYDPWYMTKSVKFMLLLTIVTLNSHACAL